MIGFIIRWLIIAASVAVAAWIVPGIRIDDDRGVSAILIMAAVLAVVNLLVKPVLTAVSCCLIIVTLGLFLLVINTLTFWLASGIASDWFDAGFHVSGFWAAFLGGVIVSIVSWLLTAFVDN
ncbi:MAG: phage holin family protein [Thermomicrobiales bacterium]|nr:phage holin family protein [Thermomicrobiales bacterium]